MTSAHVHDGEAPTLDIDRLDVYRIALDFSRLAAEIARPIRGELRSQLDRATSSILLNLAEGVGRRSPGERRHFYSIARGSAYECAAILDLLAGRGSLPLGDLRAARSLLVRVVQMLTRLAQRWAHSARPSMMWL